MGEGGGMVEERGGNAGDGWIKFFFGSFVGRELGTNSIARCLLFFRSLPASRRCTKFNPRSRA